MQRYRVNYKLLVGLFVGSVLLTVTAIFLWKWQVNRNATWFRESSQAALEAGKQEEAFDQLLKYVQLRRDEDEPRLELAKIGLELIKNNNTKQEIRQQSFGVLEETVRRTGEPELTREFIKLIIGFRPQDALTHLDELLRNNPNDSELLAMEAQALYRVKGVKPAMDLCIKLVGYDQVTQEFDASKAKAKDRPEVYTLLASLVIEKDDDKELAERVIDEMVKVNPDSSKAYLSQSVFLRTSDKKEEANAALARAYELDPDDLSILLQKGAVAFEEKNYEEAEETFTDALAKHPDELVLYDWLSRAQIQKEELDKALATLEQGLQKIGPERAIVFSRNKINIYFQQQDFASVNKELAKLTKTENPAWDPFIEFTKARMVWQQQQWNEAARLLKTVFPKLIDYPQEQAMAGLLLGAAYERQGKVDMARQSYTQAVEKHPQYEAAKLALKNLNDRTGVAVDSQAGDLDKAIEQMAEMPETQQDWARIDDMVEKIAKDREFSEARKKLVQANVLMKRKYFEEAKEKIREAALLEPENINIRFAAITLLAAEPDSGPVKALAVLDKLQEQMGDNLRIRLVRAQLLRGANQDNVIEQLEALTADIDSWSQEERAELFANLSAQFEQLGQFDKAQEYLKQAIELVPESLPARMRLFEVAFQKRDIPAMRDAEAQILDIVKDKNDGNYIYCVVRRLMWEFTQEKALREELVDARKMLDGVLQRRPQWPEAHVLYGQLLLVLQEDQDVALKHLDDALKYGPPNINALAMQVKLLGQRGQMAEAREKMNLIPKQLRQQLLGRANAEILILTGDKQEAFKSAKEFAAAEADNASTQVWLARFANEIGDLPTAVAAMNKATELEPTNSDNWMQLLSLHAGQKNLEGIEDTMRRAQLAIEGDFLPLLTAKKYELMGDWRAAEKIYLASFSSRIDEPNIAQRLAEFYLMWAQAGKTTISQAAPYINHLLRQANEGKIEQSNPYVSWARDKAARLLASSGDYQQSLKAQRLLRNGEDLKDVLQHEKALLSEILASRGEPQAQLQAINLLSEMDRNGTISREGVLSLARLLSKTGNWKRAEELMLNAITKFGSDEQVRTTFINLLIERGEYGVARSQLEELKKINPNSTQIFPLSIKIAAASGNRSQLRNMLQSMAPQNLTGALDKAQLDKVRMVARLAMENEEYELADKLYRVYVSRVPDANLEFARFLALHGNSDEAMTLLKQLFPQGMDEVTSICAEMLRRRRAEVGDKYDAEIDEMVAASLRDDPESVRRLLLKAEMLETQGKYEASIAQYDRVLARDDVPRMMRAAAMNNLGFLLTLLNQRTEEAEGLINQALEIYGPVDDILDTRALARMARKDYDQAVEDMSLATSLSSDPIKFYHFAQANLLAGNGPAAVKAWDKAQQLGFKKEKLPILEQKNFDRVKAEIEGLRTQNVKL